MRIPLKRINTISGGKYTTAYIDINIGYWGIWLLHWERGDVEIFGFGVNLHYWNILEVES